MAPTYTFFCDPCDKGYEEILSVKDYDQPTKCPKCKRVGKKTIELAQREPTFSDKMFPYYDRALNKVFERKSDRAAYLKKHNLGDGNNGTMTRQQERKLYDWRMGRFDPRIARHAIKD